MNISNNALIGFVIINFCLDNFLDTHMEACFLLCIYLHCMNSDGAM